MGYINDGRYIPWYKEQQVEPVRNVLQKNNVEFYQTCSLNGQAVFQSYRIPVVLFLPNGDVGEEFNYDYGISFDLNS